MNNESTGQIDWAQWENAAVKANQRDKSHVARMEFLRRGGQITRISLKNKQTVMTKCSYFRAGVGAREYWGPGYVPRPGHILTEDNPAHISHVRWMRKTPQRVAPTPVE